MEEKREKKFGSRYLIDDSMVFEYNAWDNFVWNRNDEEEAIREILRQNQSKICENDANKLIKNASEMWNKFYLKHKNKFFMDRNWLLNEFNELNLENLVRFFYSISFNFFYFF